MELKKHLLFFFSKEKWLKKMEHLIHEKVLKEVGEIKNEANRLGLQLIELQRDTQDKKEQLTAAIEEVNHKDSLLKEYQKTIVEQRLIIEKKQRTIFKLETKIEDLLYEIRSLLQLESKERQALSTPIHPEGSLRLHNELNVPYDFALFVNRFVKMAENVTGSVRLGSKKYFDISLESNAIEKRLFFDQFREERAGIIFVYSLLENRLLFVNNHSKTILGWSPEKLIKDFSELAVDGYANWREGILHGATTRNLTLKSKEGKEIPFQSFMERIQKGPFIHHVIGILADERDIK